MLRIELLGSPGWHSQGGSAPLKPKDAAWITCLAVRGTHDRDALARQVWPSVDAELAATSLRQRIKRLRGLTGHGVCQAGASVQLLASVSVDLHDPLHELPAEVLLARGELLAGMEFKDIPRFQQWLARERDNWRRLLAAALDGKAEEFEQGGRNVEALALCHRALQLDPLLEVAGLRQMRLHYLQGNRAAAIETFERLQRVASERGLHVEPEALELRALAERGAAAPVRSNRLPASLLRTPVLVGRMQEWLAMDRAWEAGRPFLLRGEAGIGKTRLMDEYVDGLPGMLMTESRPGDDQSGYTLLRRLLRAVLQRHAVVPDEFVRHELSRLLLEFGPAPVHSAGQSAVLWQAVESLLLAALQQGLGALMVDNLHFADLPSIEALRWLSASKPLGRLRFGFTTRDQMPPASAALLESWLTDPERPVPVDLGPLTPGELAELITTVALPELLPATLAAPLHAHAGGHPFFCIEILKDVAQKGGTPAALMLGQPATVTPLLQSRLRAVPEAHTELLWVAATLGGDFSEARAAAVLGLEAAALRDAVATVERCQVFKGVAFAHDLLRECALQQVPKAQRAPLHARVAAVLADDPAVPPGRLAHHWQVAERWAPAARCLQAAAAAARTAGQLQDQLALLEQAAACWRRSGDAAAEFDALRLRADSLQVLRGPAALLEESLHLEDLARTLARPQQLAVQVLRAEALVHLMRNEESLQAADAVLQQAAASPHLLIEALIVRATALTQTGRQAEALQAHHRAAELAEQHGPPALALRLTHLEVVLLFQAGRIGLAVAAARKSAQLAKDARDPMEAVQVEGNLCTLLMVAGETRQAYPVARELRRQHEVMGSSTHSITRGLNLVALGNAAAWLGHFDEALEALSAATQVLDERAASSPHTIASLSLANLWLTLGDKTEAHAALPAKPDGMAPGMQMRWHWAKAQLNAVNGRPDALHLQRMGEIQRANPALPHGQSAWLEWSRQGEAQPVVERLRTLRQEAEAAGMPGFARSTMVRELDRLAELEGPEAIASTRRLANELGELSTAELSPQIHLPEGRLDPGPRLGSGWGAGTGRTGQGRRAGMAARVR